MLLASDVKEEAEGVLTLVPAEVTFERLWQPMVAHVDGVHGAVHERNPAKLVFSLDIFSTLLSGTRPGRSAASSSELVSTSNLLSIL